MGVSSAGRRCPAPVTTPCCPFCRRLAGVCRDSRTRWRNTHRWQPAWRQARTCLVRRSKLPPHFLPSIRAVAHCRPKRSAWLFLRMSCGCDGRGRRRRTTPPCRRDERRGRACRHFASCNASLCRRRGK